MHQISLKPETLIHLSSFNLTNTLLTSFILVFLISISLLILASKASVSKPSKSQSFFELIYQALGGIFSDITHSDFKKSAIFSFVFSAFIYILVSNWFGLLPIVGNIGFVHHSKEENKSESYVVEDVNAEIHNQEVSGPKHEDITILSCIAKRDCVFSNGSISKTHEFTSLFRAPTSDISVTLGLALVSVLMANIIGIKHLKFSYLKKYINFSGPIDFFVGILELISELGKIVSFSFRLFGNVFAGEVLLVVITYITYGIGTLPFMGLELFLGAIQAFVFFILTVVFINLASSHHA